MPEPLMPVHIDQLRVQMMEAMTEYGQAADRLHLAEARVLRHDLLALAEQTPGVTGFRYSVTSEYDDEGSYYDSISIYADMGEDFPEHLDEVCDSGFDKESYSLVFGAGYVGEGGVVTIDELRALSL